MYMYTDSQFPLSPMNNNGKETKEIDFNLQYILACRLKLF